MSFSATFTLTVGSSPNVGPFDIVGQPGSYSVVTNVSRADLAAGQEYINIPNTVTSFDITSGGACINSINVPISIPVTYNCDGTNCYEVYDGTGTYEFLSDCQLNCGQTGGGGGCFISGTTITMSDGSIKLIEELVVGDSLLSYDILGLPLYSDEPSILDTWVDLDIQGQVSEASIVSITPLEVTEIVVINDLLKTTPNHRHLTKRGDYWSFKRADEVIVGDVMLDINNNEIEILTTDIQIIDITVYNMNVESLDVFYANGILTHNYKLPTQE